MRARYSIVFSASLSLKWFVSLSVKILSFAHCAAKCLVRFNFLQKVRKAKLYICSLYLNMPLKIFLTKYQRIKTKLITYLTLLSLITLCLELCFYKCFYLLNKCFGYIFFQGKLSLWCQICIVIFCLFRELTVTCSELMMIWLLTLREGVTLQGRNMKMLSI